MSTHVLLGSEPGSTKPLACWFCSTTDIAFGPVFHGDGFDSPEDEADKFEVWLAGHPPTLQTSGYPPRPAGDPRAYVIAELMDLYRMFRREVEAEMREGARI